MVKVDKDLIQIPYTTRPSMRRYTGPIFSPVPDPAVLKQKQIELEKWGQDLYGETNVVREKRLIECAAEFFNLPVAESIVDFAMNFEEDVAILNNGQLAAICFCFPSSWIPRARLGQLLSKIHQPVGDGQHLVRASPRLAEAMADVKLGSFRRTVWTVTCAPELSNHPRIIENYKDLEPTLENLYFRTETQTTCPLGDGRTSLFFVKVNVLPLLSIWSQHKQNIVDSINSMSETVCEYKKLNKIKTYLNKL